MYKSLKVTLGIALLVLSIGSLIFAFNDDLKLHYGLAYKLCSVGQVLLYVVLILKLIKQRKAARNQA